MMFATVIAAATLSMGEPATKAPRPEAPRGTVAAESAGPAAMVPCYTCDRGR
ncbi:hypothetical protein [Allosediminivita pacifica]|uniref:Uncharacterized protein n=1 Tax=Allosediminivita pacifica TaxID=1267769 RepID=A0A2T6AX34_9RHOB|nr:hypothetical protein [Allosediminivita pacifica]PTX48359.1 hypothetical protein C8N44_10949 [Allosediminivita pacifica]GGB11074.1 hypothetical protein GCM10011324_21500 [Allosediminivita pacifica]